MENEWVIFTGRIVIAFSGAFIMQACMRVLDESVPVQIFASVYVGQAIAINCLSELLMIGTRRMLPNYDDSQGLLTTQYWRVFVAIGLIFSVSALLILAFVVKLESPKFYLMAGDDDRALEAISRIYHRDEDPDAII